MCTLSSSSIARFRASARFIFRWRSSTSVICVPILSVGFSEVIGSWKIIEISLPRMFSSSDSLRPTSSRPSNITEPPTTFPGGCTMPMIELAVTDLPQPDSPTIPSVFPRSSSNEIPSTARTSPSRVLNTVRRSLTSSSATAALLGEVLPRSRVERVAEAVGDEEGAQDEPRDAEAGHDDDVRVGLVRGVPVLRERAPRGLGRGDPEGEEGQERLAEHHAGELEKDEDDDDPERVREQVPEEHPVPARPNRVRGAHVVV